MTVFKTFWKVVKKYKGTVLLYTIILLVFGIINMQTKESNINFVGTKPDILIINEDKEGKLSKNLENYLRKNCNCIELKQEEIDDALFYRKINYMIHIKKNYSKEIMENKNPEIDVKSTRDYNASLAELMLKRYVKVQNVYKTKIKNEEDLIQQINKNLKENTTVQISSKIDNKQVENASYYFSFASYSIMAVVIFVICLVLSSFKEKNVNKRTLTSSMNYKKYNRYLLIASLLYALVVWIIYMILGIIILKDIMLTPRGGIYALNSFCFTFTSLTLALLISNLVKDKNAVNGIVNIIALGSSFLCGAFVPQEFLPDNVLKIAHMLPTYFYISSNELLKKIEVINLKELQSIFQNCLIMFLFAIFFIIVNNRISKYKRKVG
ncbi:MAG: ABC transporter permease [Bacilli bacterium]|nr:ABC transporter permease [Bacilli bacterium]